jgi:hypothetical protein
MTAMKPAERKQLLLSSVMQLIEKGLAGQGLRMFGAVLGDGREIKLLVPKTIKENASLDEVDEYWMEQLRSNIGVGGDEIACYCTDLSLATEDGQPIASAVLIYVEQACAKAEYHCYPYQRCPESVALGEPTIEQTPNRLWAV